MNKKLPFIIATILLLTGCSRKKDNFMSRNWHAVTAEYNTLFNGNNALQEGRTALINAYTDNFWEVLPVERLETFNEVTLPGASKNESFAYAEEKAIKAIQKHSMEINGKERNPQIDEAFMLLGKARYYDQRFVRSLEAFNYILAYYPASNSIAQAKIWKEKANMRLDNNAVAAHNLQEILIEEEELDDQDYADASATLAQAFLNQEKIDSALIFIKKAATLTRKNEEKGRYRFIQGQLYDALGKKDSANLAYEAVIDLNRKSPRQYMINAYIAQARNFDYTQGDRQQFLEVLQDLAANRENRPYLDRIDNQLAEYYLNIGKEDSAILFYNSSLRRQSRDRYLNSRNYKKLAQINFDNAQYQLAGAYYDSTLTALDKKTREFRDITKRRENLNDVILYERISQDTDSILSLVAMGNEDRRAYFQTYIDSLKAKAEADSLAIASGQIQNNEFFSSSPLMGPQAGEGGTFYFYNTTAVAQGKLKFESRWGNRDRVDNWRVSSLIRAVAASGDTTVDQSRVENDNARYDIEQYISAIPSEPKILDSLRTKRNFANYQLGLIYKEKFKEYDLAAQRLEQMLNQDPEERLILPAKYYLYQIYKSAGLQSKGDTYRKDILDNYQDSRYAEILKNPDANVARDQDSPEAVYNALYRRFQNQEYSYVIAQAEEYIRQFAGDLFVPKFELLKATAIGRAQGYLKYKEALNYVAVTYPNQDEGKKAQELIDTVLPQLENDSFIPDEEAVGWKLLFISNDIDASKNTVIALDKINRVIEDSSYSGYSVSKDFYEDSQLLLVIHGFNTEAAALSFAERLRNTKNLEWSLQPITISNANYRTIQIHKNLPTYINQDSN